MWQDLRYSLRTLLKQHYFTATAVLVLALAIGLNTAMFTLVNSLFFRPLAAHEPDRLRFVYLTDPGVPNFVSSLRYGDYLDLRAGQTVFTDLLARSPDQAQIEASGDIFQARGEMVSGNYFDLLGVRALHGRSLAPEDDDPAAERVIVVSAGFWKARLGGSPDVIGSAVRIDQGTYTVVGVAPDWFKGTLGNWEQAQYWAPLRQRVFDAQCAQPARPLETRGVGIIGRLAPGITSAAAQASLAGLRIPPTSRPANAEPRNALWTPELFEAGRANLPFTGFGRIVPERLALALMGLAGLVLLIGGMNVAGLLIARSVKRRTETATRLALGASRWRIGRQLLLESLLLSTTGALFGLLIAHWLTAAFVKAIPGQFRRLDLNQIAPAQMLSIDAPVDWRVVGFTLVVSVVAALVIGILPSLRASRTGVLGALTSAAGGAPAQGGRRLRAWIIIPQVCLSLGLLVLAGVLVRSTAQASRIDHGYDPSGIIAIGFNGPTADWLCERRQPSAAEVAADQEARAAFNTRVLAAARTIPGVEQVSLSWSLPHVTGMGSWIRGLEPRDDGTVAAAYISRVPATPGHFELLGIPIVHGRSFDELENANDARVAVISEGLARALWGSRNPIGRHVAFQEPASTHPPQWHEVIGVVGDVRTPMAAGDWQRPAAYVPLGRNFAMVLAARGALPPHQMIPALKTAIADVNRSVRIGDGGTVQDAIASYLLPRRLAAGILSAAGLMGLLMASIGIYGVVSYSVAQRVREIGVRMAFGAERVDIIRLIAGETGRVVAAGIVLGLAAGYAAVRLTSWKVVEMPPLDAVTLVTAPGIIAVIVLLACLIPARRAATVDPMVALREL